MRRPSLPLIALANDFEGSELEQTHSKSTNLVLCLAPKARQLTVAFALFHSTPLTRFDDSLTCVFHFFVDACHVDPNELSFYPVLRTWHIAMRI